MFTWWGTQVVRRRRVVLVLAGAALVFAAVWGTGVFGALVSGGFDDPAGESSRASALLDERVGRTDADLLLVVGSELRTVDDPGYEDAVASALDTLPAEEVEGAVSFWSTGAAELVSADRLETYVVVTLTSVEAVDSADLDLVRSELTDAGYTAQLGGRAAVNADITDRVSADIARAETISLPILLILLVVIFGGLVAASLPLLIGGIAILGSFTALRALTEVTEVSIFAVNLVTILGLGLAIDYGLLMVGRFREELAAGYSTAEAVSRTVRTAGRTVAVSALTVAVSLGGLLLFGQTFLRSMGYGGIAAVLVAAIAAIVILPAVLAALGPRVDRFAIRRRRPAAPREETSSFWYRLAHSVMRRPGRYLIGGLLVLAFLTAPFLGVTFGGVDERVLPADAEPRQVSEQLAADFGATSADPIVVAASLADPVDSAEGQVALDTYVGQLDSIEGVTGVAVTGARDRTARLDLSYDGAALDGPVKSIVTDIRADSLPAGIDSVLVGGETALLVDRLDSIGATLPWMALLIAAATFVLLFLAFGSVLLPIKAIVLNLASLGASLGVVTWIFQDGNLSGLLGFTPTGFVEATQPILVAAIVFGLSMDYEVFLLSRIREEYDRTGDNTTAVASGLARTGRIITAAALLIIVVIAAFSTSSISFIQLIGIAMLVAILIDALLVRMLIVPALMRLMGGLNWWAPPVLRRVYERFGLSESVEPASAGGPSVSPSSGSASEPAESTPRGELAGRR